MVTRRQLAETYTQYWNESTPAFPSFGNAISSCEKRRREQIFDRYISTANTLTGTHDQQFRASVTTLLCDGLDFSAQQLGVMLSDNVLEVSRQFIQQARLFDSQLTFDEIFQACRNVWVMTGLQLVLGLPVRLTHSIFAYSLLYPYTDNLIDDPNISKQNKAIFSENFRARLCGESPKPRNHAERAIYRLVGMIEKEFPRNDYPDVYESLLAIHDAQTKSMQLLASSSILTHDETLEICIAKGGTSIVADGYLVAGHLTRDQEFFLYGYGAYLQLLDDLQDAMEDRAAGLQTIFSRSDGVLESQVNMTHSFSSRVIHTIPLFGVRHLDVFASLMCKSMDLLIISAIAQNPDLFNDRYVAEIEVHSPFGFAYVQRHKEHFVPYNGFLLTGMYADTFVCNENRRSAI
jgi:hypothetical protein